MIVLFTDYGTRGPYVGQMKAVLERQAPGVPMIDLMHDAPAHNPRAAAYLLAALAAEFALGTMFLAVVDPGVGGPRPPVVVEAGGRWFVGPGNGLFEIIARRERLARSWPILLKPQRLSASFHGRDLFAPAIARLARHGIAAIADETAAASPLANGSRPGAVWLDDVSEVIYIDGFGNAMTGLRADKLGGDIALKIKNRNGQDRAVKPARTFSDVPEGAAFWYPNAIGLAEIAVNRGRADQMLGLGIGSHVGILVARRKTGG